MEANIQKTNNKIFLFTVLLVFSFVIGLSYVLSKTMDEKSKIVQGKYTININASGLGESSTINGKSDGEYSLALNTGKYEFVDGSFTCSGNFSQQMYYEETSTIELTGITSNVNCNIRFQEKQIRVKFDCINCTVSNDDFQYIKYGDSIEFYVHGNYGYEYTYNTCEAESLGNNKYIIRDIISPISCTFAYSDPNYVRTYTLLASSTNPSMGDVRVTNQTVKEYGTGTIEVLPKDGYRYKSNSCNALYSNGTLTIPNIVSHMNCLVTFTIDAAGPELSVDAYVSNSDGGSVNPKHQIVPEYNPAIIILSPNPGYLYAGNDCGAMYKNGVLTLNSVTKNINCKVIFQSKQRTINFTASVNNSEYGSVSPRSQVVNENSIVTLKITPKNGYKYIGNSCNGIFNNQNSTLSVESSKNIVNCIVYFEKN